MNEAQFSDMADELMVNIEEAIEESGIDIDCEANNGVLTLTMEENGSVVIVSRQTAISQIWVAAKSGGFHHNYDGAKWICSVTGETLQTLLTRTCFEQCGEKIKFEL